MFLPTTGNILYYYAHYIYILCTRSVQNIACQNITRRSLIKVASPVGPDDVYRVVGRCCWRVVRLFGDSADIRVHINA